MVNDPIADLLTRIRNGYRAEHRSVRVGASKVNKRILDVLKTEGFIDGYTQKKDAQDKFNEFDVTLRYSSLGEPAATIIKRVSRSGRRVYLSGSDLPRVHGGLGISIISTSKGVVSDREARRLKVGGEVLALVG